MPYRRVVTRPRDKRHGVHVGGCDGLEASCSPPYGRRSRYLIVRTCGGFVPAFMPTSGDGWNVVCLVERMCCTFVSGLSSGVRRR